MFQVGQAPALADKNTQTDAVHFTEEDLEQLLEDDAEEPEITDVETQTNTQLSGGDNVKVNIVINILKHGFSVFCL